MTSSMTTTVTAKMNELQGGEAHFFEESLNPQKVKEYLARPKEPDKLKVSSAMHILRAAASTRQ